MHCCVVLLTNMGRWKVWFALLLLLLLTFCTDSSDARQPLVKRLGSKPDATPICTNSSLEIITLIVCKIRSERNKGEECRLLYQYGHDFVHECDSRFQLVMKNQTVYLHLTSLTPVDNGNYTCECSHPGGTFMSYLKVTVEEDEDASSSGVPIWWVLIGTALVIITAGVILGFIHWTNSRRYRSRPATTVSSVYDTCGKLDEDGSDETYINQPQRASDRYQNI